MSFPQAVFLATVQSVYTRTSGFAVIDVGVLRAETLLVIAGLMFIGGAPASTAGGIKLTTFSTLFIAIMATLRGDGHVHAFNREIPWWQVNRALSVALISVAVVFVLSFLLSLFAEAAFVEVMFEAFSAFATVGLSTGITPDLGDPARVATIIGMFVGRLGPLTIALALALRFSRRERVRYPEEELPIG